MSEITAFLSKIPVAIWSAVISSLLAYFFGQMKNRRDTKKDRLAKNYDFYAEFTAQVYQYQLWQKQFCELDREEQAGLVALMNSGTDVMGPYTVSLYSDFLSAYDYLLTQVADDEDYWRCESELNDWFIPLLAELLKEQMTLCKRLGLPESGAEAFRRLQERPLPEGTKKQA